MTRSNHRCLSFVGTDTSVGKTVVASAVASFFRNQGYDVGVFKPAESGCAASEQGLAPSDTLMLARAAGCPADLDLINPYRFASPISPQAAARRDLVTIDMERILDCFSQLVRKHQVLIMEGAGGLMVL